MKRRREVLPSRSYVVSNTHYIGSDWLGTMQTYLPRFRLIRVTKQFGDLATMRNCSQGNRESKLELLNHAETVLM